MKFCFVEGVCRQYSTRGKPCAVYGKNDISTDETIDDETSGMCKKTEECLPPNDRAKHGYCQCRLGYVRSMDTDKCIEDQTNQLSSVSIVSATSSTSAMIDVEVQAGDDQVITLPVNQIELNGRVISKLNKTDLIMSVLNSQKLNLIWSLKSSTDQSPVDIFQQKDVPSHVTVKQLRQGTYQFELTLIDKQGATIASDVVKIEVAPGNRMSCLFSRIDRIRTCKDRHQRENCNEYLRIFTILVCTCIIDTNRRRKMISIIVDTELPMHSQSII
jgi:hypothetical protein